MFQSQQSQAPKFGTLLGSTTAPTGGLFGASTQPQQRSSLFGGSLGGATTSTAPTTGLFGAPLGASQQQPQQQQSLFGGSIQQQPQSTLLGGFAQPQPRPLGQPVQVTDSAPLAQSRLGLSMGPPPTPRDKPALEQISLIFRKWSPNDPSCVLEGYTYNQIEGGIEHNYGPGPNEDTAKWEEALSKKPAPNMVPLQLRGFQAIAVRIEMQNKAARILVEMLHQLNTRITGLMDRHDLQIQVRCNEARNRHKVFTQRVVKLAAKVQILRNRGYAMDSTEEELKKKLVELEKKAFDPVLGGRQEEIWARMSAARARAQILQAESEKLGQATNGQNGSVLNEEEQKALRKLLEDYDSQLTHLKNEIDQIQQDYSEWEKAQKPA